MFRANRIHKITKSVLNPAGTFSLTANLPESQSTDLLLPSTELNSLMTGKSEREQLFHESNAETVQQYQTGVYKYFSGFSGFSGLSGAREVYISTSPAPEKCA